MRPKYDFKEGDIVTCTARRGEYIYKVLAVEMKEWTAKDAQWKYCDPADVGTQYIDAVKIRSIYQFVLNPSTKKTRAKGLTTSPYYIQKVDPMKVQESVRDLEKTLIDMFP
jgi:hypothetical protein